MLYGVRTLYTDEKENEVISFNFIFFIRFKKTFDMLYTAATQLTPVAKLVQGTF
jgi:hypothetical protein